MTSGVNTGTVSTGGCARLPNRLTAVKSQRNRSTGLIKHEGPDRDSLVNISNVRSRTPAQKKQNTGTEEAGHRAQDDTAERNRGAGTAERTA